MITRDILDSNGVKIGEISLPDSASEADIGRALSSYTEIPQIPDVTPRQIRTALVLSGISLDSIDSLINSLPEPTKSIVKIEWQHSIAFQRNRPTVAQMGAMLGMSSAQMDALWAFAATL